MITASETRRNGNAAVEFEGIDTSTITYSLTSPPEVHLGEVVAEGEWQELVMDSVSDAYPVGNPNYDTLMARALKHYKAHQSQVAKRAERRTRRRNKNEKSLESLADELSNAMNGNSVVYLTDIDSSARKLAEAYQGSFRQKGSHRSLTINGIATTWSPGSKYKDGSTSVGTIKSVVETLSLATDIPEEHLRLYLTTGNGNIQSQYKKTFEARYFK